MATTITDNDIDIDSYRLELKLIVEHEVATLKELATTTGEPEAQAVWLDAETRRAALHLSVDHHDRAWLAEMLNVGLQQLHSR